MVACGIAGNDIVQVLANPLALGNLHNMGHCPDFRGTRFD